MGDFDDPHAEDRSFLRESVSTCLKRLDSTKTEELAEKMLDDGINKDNVSVVEAENLVALGFDKYQAAQLIKYWKEMSNVTSVQTHPNSSETGENQAGPSRGAGSLGADHAEAGPSGSQQAPPTPTGFVDIANFKIKWDLVNDVTYQGIKAGDVIKRGEPFGRFLQSKVAHELIRQVKAAKISQITRETMNVLYYSHIVPKNLESFKTSLASGEKNSGGFLHVLKFCFDNDNRVDRNKHLQDGDYLTRRFEQPRGKFSYGCVRWRVRDHPPSQTDETVQEQQAIMKKDYDEVRPQFWDWPKISDMMKNCYKTQRDMINKNIADALEEAKKNLASKRRRKGKGQDTPDPDGDLEERGAPVTISKVHEAWPFLFNYQGMLLHFETLTEVDMEKEWNTTTSGPKWGALLDFFRTCDDDFYRNTIKRMERYNLKKPDAHNELKAVILMIVKYFNEKNFIDIVDETVTMEVLNEQKKAPQYPALTAPGKDQCVFKAKKFFLGVDGDYYYSYIDFKRAVFCVYMLYYVFNLDYAPETQITLEFMQRFIFNMDPPQGNKRPARGPKQPKVKYSTKIIHDDVAKLVSKLNELIKQKEQDDLPADSDSSVPLDDGDEEED